MSAIAKNVRWSSNDTGCYDTDFQEGSRRGRMLVSDLRRGRKTPLALVHIVESMPEELGATEKGFLFEIAILAAA